MTTQTEITNRHHHRAVRFFWGLLIGATMVSLVGNIAHAVLPYLSPILSRSLPPQCLPSPSLPPCTASPSRCVRGRPAWCTAGGRAVAVIGVGAFAVSFLALRDLMQAIGYSSTTAWIFPAIIDTAVAVSTLMLVALGGSWRLVNGSGQARKPQHVHIPLRTVRCHNGVTTHALHRRMYGSTRERKSLLDRENQTPTDPHEHDAADLKSAQCEFESHWGHR